MTTEARALVLEAPHRLVARSIPLPDPGPHAALLRVEACGLCGTDHEQYTGVLPFTGCVPGHETVGTIERIGSEASTGWGLSEGDRVAVEPFLSCRTCEPCRRGEYRRCERHGLFAAYGFTPADTPPGLWGGYATHQYVHPDSMLLRVPDGLDPVLATVFNPLGAGVRWAATLPATSDGDVVAVLGPGIRGLCCAAAAKEAGAGFVMVTGLGEHDRPRLEVAHRFGADLVVDVAETDPVEALRQAAGRDADVVVDVTAKAPAAFAQAIKLTRAGGTVVVAGTRGTPGAPGFAPDEIVYKEIRLLGAFGVDTPAYERAFEILASGRWPFADLPRRTEGLEGAEGLLRTMAGIGGIPPVHAVIVPQC